MELLVRILALTILVTGMVSAAAPVRTQTYDPSYPVCLQTEGGDNYIECRYTSLPQCNASASGRAAQCVVNPFFAHPTKKPVGGMGRR
jgi:hypothetical protein